MDGNIALYEFSIKVEVKIGSFTDFVSMSSCNGRDGCWLWVVFGVFPDTGWLILARLYCLLCALVVGYWIFGCKMWYSLNAILAVGDRLWLQGRLR